MDQIIAVVLMIAAGGQYDDEDWIAMASAFPRCRYEYATNCVWVDGPGYYDAGTGGTGVSFIAVKAADGRSDVVLYRPVDGVSVIRTFAK